MLMATSLQVLWEYSREVRDIERGFDVVEKSYLPSLSESVWLVDHEQLRILLAGIQRLPNIGYAMVAAEGKEIAASGKHAAAEIVMRQWPLTRRYRERDVVIGQLTVQASLAGPRANTLDRLGFMLLSSVLWIAAVASLMFVVVHWLITRHLERIADYVASTDPKRLEPSLVLDRPPNSNPDEFDRLVGALNTTAKNVRSSQDQMRLAASVFDNANEGILITDGNNNILSVNRAFTAITGYPAEEVIGRNPRMLSSGRQSVDFYRAMWKSIEQTGRWQGEVWDTRKDGQPYCELLSIAAISNEQGEIIQHCAIFADITRLKMTEAELLRVNADLESRVVERTAALEHANRELESFSYSVSHDLRAPLRHIGGFSAIVLKANQGKLDEASVDYLKRIEAAVERMGKLIDDLLALASVSRLEMNQQQIDLSNLAGQVVDSLVAAHPDREVLVSVQQDMGAHGDPGLVRIVLENLIANAWKFTSHTDRATMSIGCEQREGETVYFVSDNGAGFDMKYADKLFGAFQRLHTDREFKGTGIGLSIVQRIVARHGGKIWADAKVGEGATFHFTLAQQHYRRPAADS
jgi:PAS domain S-box-containing protein